MTVSINPNRGRLPICLQDHSDDPEDSRRLWALTRTQRVEAMWAQLLTLSQLNEWTRKAPDEVPNLGREFAWLVMQTDEWLDQTAEQKTNVIQLHTPRRIERVAA